jgi:hypothetical protein
VSQIHLGRVVAQHSQLCLLGIYMQSQMPSGCPKKRVPCSNSNFAEWKMSKGGVISQKCFD